MFGCVEETPGVFREGVARDGDGWTDIILLLSLILLWYYAVSSACSGISVQRPGLLSVLREFGEIMTSLPVGIFLFLPIHPFWTCAEEETMFRNAAKKPLHHSRRSPAIEDSLWRFLHLARWYRLIVLADRSIVTQLCLFTSINHGESRKQGGVEYVKYLLHLLMLRGTLYI